MRAAHKHNLNNKWMVSCVRMANLIVDVEKLSVCTCRVTCMDVFQLGGNVKETEI